MKRSRSASPSPAPSWSSLSSTDPAETPSNLESMPSVYRSHKHVRSAQDASTSAEPLIRCTIGPICSASPQTFSTQKALQSHYVKAHSFVCKGLVSRDRKQWGLQGANAEDTLGDGQGSGEMEECGKIFPEDRLLELHIIENHDPIALVRQSHGEKIFECFLPREVCPQRFNTPKERRKHVVRKHHYSKQYFFSVINHGIGSLLQRFGPGVSLIRPAWNPRAETSSTTSAVPTRAHHRSPTSASPLLPNDSMSGDMRRSRTGPKQRIDVRSSENSGPRRHAERQDAAGHSESGGDSSDGMSSDADMDTYEPGQTCVSLDRADPALEQHLQAQAPLSSSITTATAQDTGMDDLTRTMAGTSLAFVPRGVRKKQREAEKTAQSSMAMWEDAGK